MIFTRVTVYLIHIQVNYFSSSVPTLVLVAFLPPTSLLSTHMSNA